MIFEHYGFQPIPQHIGNWHFKEQLAHLEIAVIEQEKAKRVNSIVRPKLPFEETRTGKVLAFLQDCQDFISYREMAEKTGIPRKSCANAVNQLRKEGYGFEEKANRQLVMVKLK